MKTATRDELKQLLNEGRTLVVTPRLCDVPDLSDAFPAVVVGCTAHSVVGDFEWEFDPIDFAPRDMFYVYDYADIKKAVSRLENVINADLSRLTLGE